MLPISDSVKLDSFQKFNEDQSSVDFKFFCERKNVCLKYKLNYLSKILLKLCLYWHSYIRLENFTAYRPRWIPEKYYDPFLTPKPQANKDKVCRTFV